MSAIKEKLLPLLVGVIILAGGAHLLAFRLPRPQGVPIAFHGVVRDQLGEPVPNALVAYTVRRQPAGQVLKGTDRYNATGMLKSNADGAFEIREQGGYLYIQQVYKPGYLFEPLRDAFIYESSRYCYDGSPYCPAYTMHVPDPANPVVVNAWRVKETAELETGEESYTYPMDGESHRVPMEGLDDGFRATFVRLPAATDDRRDQPWRVTFSVTDGGMVDSDDHFMFVAPEDGYLPEISFEAPDDGWVEKTFYIRADGGNVHARIKLRFTGYYGKNEKGFITYVYALNPSSSRILLPEVSPYFEQWSR